VIFSGVKGAGARSADGGACDESVPAAFDADSVDRGGGAFALVRF